MHEFERQDTTQTLAEGLAEYHHAHPGLTRGDALSPDAREFFRCHDVVHVVFGCDTSLPREAVVKLSSLFGTTGGFSVLRGYRLHESIDIYRRLDPVEALTTILRSVVIVPRTLIRCLRQRKRWPWAEFARHLDSPLHALRAEYGIRVAANGANPTARKT
jgi:hypothetical protein